MSRIETNNQMISHLNDAVTAIKDGRVEPSLEYLTSLTIPVLADIAQSLAVIADIMEAQMEEKNG